MCDPLTIAGAAATVGGTFMQMRSQQKAADKVRQVLSRNAESQENLRRDSQAGVQDAAGEFDRTKFDQTQSDETALLKQRFTDNLSQGDLPGEYYGGRESENTKKYTEKKTGEANIYSQQLADALARMRGFDQGLSKTNLGINRASEKVVMNNGFMDGNNAILPGQIEAAKQSGANPLADIMVGLGGASLNAGLAGKTIPGFGGGNPNAIANPNIKGTKYLLA